MKKTGEVPRHDLDLNTYRIGDLEGFASTGDLRQ